MNTQKLILTCPLCHSQNSFKIQGLDKRTFYKCNTCYLIYVDPLHHPTKEVEKNRYLAHENGVEFPGYVAFLNKAIEPAMQFLRPDMLGLDYGCGSNPTLSKLLSKRGIKCENYDPIFFPNTKTKQHYSFIFATECFEHFFFPSKDIEQIISHMQKDSYLIVMTNLWNNIENFKGWSYAKDFTHASFYNKNTINWIATHFGLKKVYDDEQRVIIFRLQL
ncbi:MAG: class I SAM-dependent methyltransferase [Endomicrobiales bacterium]|nr:class I SAM-dependent methyltransferase [Endomicrobiales bacterium]